MIAAASNPRVMATFAGQPLRQIELTCAVRQEVARLCHVGGTRGKHRGRFDLVPFVPKL